MQALKSQEYVVFHIPAYAFRGMNAAFGRMRITNRRILFDPLDGSLDDMMDYDLGSIEPIERCNTYLVVPNGVKLSLPGGVSRIFALRNRTRVIRYMQKRLPKPRRKRFGCITE